MNAVVLKMRARNVVSEEDDRFEVIYKNIQKIEDIIQKNEFYPIIISVSVSLIGAVFSE